MSKTYHTTVTDPSIRNRFSAKVTIPDGVETEIDRHDKISIFQRWHPDGHPIGDGRWLSVEMAAKLGLVQVEFLDRPKFKHAVGDSVRHLIAQSAFSRDTKFVVEAQVELSDGLRGYVIRDQDNHAIILWRAEAELVGGNA